MYGNNGVNSIWPRWENFTMIYKALNTLWTVRSCLVPRRDVSLSMKNGTQRKVGRRKRARDASHFSPLHRPFQFATSNYCVTRVSRLPLCEKRSARGGCRNSPSSFLVRRVKRAKHDNDHERDWKPPSFLASRWFAARRSSERALFTKSEEKGRLPAV